MRQHDTGNMCYSYEYRNARYWGREINISNNYIKSSHGRKISLDPLSETHTPLRELLTGHTREASNFKEHIRVYNLAVAFESMGAEIKSPLRNGPYYFRIHFQIYHLVSQLYSYTNITNRQGCGQLYLHDSAESTTK
jgi:hypothetical protein